MNAQVDSQMKQTPAIVAIVHSEGREFADLEKRFRNRVISQARSDFIPRVHPKHREIQGFHEQIHQQIREL